MKFRFSVIGLAVAALCWTTTVQAADALPHQVKEVASVEGITEYQLKNGLRVLLFPDASKPSVTVNVTYGVGSRHEGYGETGMAHLLEHLLFKGTPKTPKVPQALVDHGAEPNGTTWFDRTNYYETMPATDENLQWALGFEADRMVNSFIAQKDLDSEMTVVRNEYEMGETNPQRVLQQRTMAAAYQWHNYGNPTIGAKSDIEKVAIENLRAFYKKYYQPDNALLVVAGRFDVKKTLQWVVQTFGKLPRPTRVLPTTYTEEPTQDGERWVTVRRSGGVQMLEAMYHVPQGAHPDYAAIDVLTLIMGDAPSGRLYKALVETKKAASVGASNFQLKDPGVVFFSATVRTEDPLEPALNALVQNLEDAAKTPFTEAEVERAKATLMKEIELTLNSSERVALQLSEWAAMGDWRMMFIHRDRIRAVTPADVTRVAKAYVKTSNRTLGTFIPTEAPDRAEMPAAPDVASVVKNYKGQNTLAAGEAFDASPKNIEARLARFRLDNGMKLLFLEKKTRGETVSVALTLRLGSEKTLWSKRVAGEWAAKMLLRGTRKKTREQIKAELDRLQAQLTVDGNATSVNVTVEARKPVLEHVLALASEVLREPAFDAKEFEQLKRETLARLESHKTEPVALAQNTLRRKLEPWPKEHPYYTPSFDESIAETQSLSLSDVKAFYDAFYGAQAGEMAVIGDFDAQALKTHLGGLWGSWKAPQPYARIPKKSHPMAAETLVIETPDKANAVYFSGMTLAMRDDHPDYPALVLGDFMLGGGFLNSRLATRLRQSEGLSYGAGSYFRAHPLDEEASLGAYAIYAPQNVGKVETAMQEEYRKVLKEGFSLEEVKKAKAGLLQQWQQDRAEDANLARTLANYLFIDRTLAFNELLESRINQLSAEQVHTAIQKHLVMEKFTTVKAGDFKAKTAAGKP